MMRKKVERIRKELKKRKEGWKKEKKEMMEKIKILERELDKVKSRKR